jgi:hypothetical protein
MVMMSKLEPNKNYIYEKVDGITYAREPGSYDRIEIGRDYERTQRDLIDFDLWHDILYESLANESLRHELDRVKMFYLLLKKQNQTIFYHPV